MRFLSRSSRALALLLALAPTLASAAEWRLRSAKIYNGLEHARVVASRVDAEGGQIDIEFDGAFEKRCPGQSETLRFKWSFSRSVAVLVPTQPVDTLVEMSSLSRTGACTLNLGTHLVLAAGQPGDSPFGVEEGAQLDAYRIGGGMARAFLDAQPRYEGSVAVMSRPPDPEHPLAWFRVDVEASQGLLRVAYLYEVVAAAPPAPKPGKKRKP